ncbi:MAG TPA: Gfo/Idh/MocA family oxidoreductase, partial [Phycisphaerales bacterium]|nr:Gfo/Idh/MocA family oxidoreductase [Phycisphaerales bacterium]
MAEQNGTFNRIITRRGFVLTTAGMAAGALSASVLGQGKPASQPSKYRLKIGVVGCGGRGTGAAANMLEASEDVEIVALADVFRDRLDGSKQALMGLDQAQASRVSVNEKRCFTGFDAYKELMQTDVDVVILATPPHFRPIHLQEAVKNGKHAFIEKPVAVDPVGAVSVMHTAEEAKKKNLSIVAGTQRRHEHSYLTTLKKLADGAIGKITGGHCYWNQGGLWMNERRQEWSDMEWQLRNWLYFTWLSGDHICEQHVHNIDVMNWVMGGHPIRAVGMGGRQVRTSPAYGNVFDHFAVEYEYPGNVLVTSMCRQIDGCASRVEEVVEGAKGVCTMAPGKGVIEGESPWQFSDENRNPYVQEQADLVQAIVEGKGLNEAKRVAESTLTAIMGRMS